MILVDVERVGIFSRQSCLVDIHHRGDKHCIGNMQTHSFCLCNLSPLLVSCCQWKNFWKKPSSAIHLETMSASHHHSSNISRHSVDERHLVCANDPMQNLHMSAVSRMKKTFMQRANDMLIASCCKVLGFRRWLAMWCYLSISGVANSLMKGGDGRQQARASVSSIKTKNFILLSYSSFELLQNIRPVNSRLQDIFKTKKHSTHDRTALSLWRKKMIYQRMVKHHIVTGLIQTIRG